MFLIVVIFLITQDCATIFTSSYQTITIETDKVTGVSVYSNGLKLGETPLEVPIKKQLNSPMITLEKDGYETKRAMLTSTIQPVSFINLLNVIAWAIDLGTGKASKYSPEYYNFEMDKSSND